MPIIRAFTGPRDELTDRQSEFIWDTLRSFPDADEVRSGCATGVDTEVALTSAQLELSAQHILYVPGAHSNFKFIRDEFRRMPHVNWEIIYCPRDNNASKAYRYRNTWMLRGSNFHSSATELQAFVPIGGKKYYSSGTWMTINIAIMNNIPVIFHELPEN